MRKKKPNIHYLDQYLANPGHPIYITVVGAGGTGSHVLSGLAQMAQALEQMGRQQIHVEAYDPDIITDNNIGRQLFSPADIGETKASVLIGRINRFYGYSWDAIPQRFDEKSPPGNIVISCVDTIASRRGILAAIEKSYVNGYSDPWRYCHYWQDIGNEKDYGQVVMGSIDKKKQKKVKDSRTMKHFFQMFPDPVEENIGKSCSAHMNYSQQNLFINKFMATFACNMLWSLFSEYFLDHQGCFVNLERFAITKIPIN